MSVLENTKFSAVVAPVEESKDNKYVVMNPKPDIENGLRLPEPKGILKNKNQDMENDTQFQMNVINVCIIFIAALFVSPFIICDLVFGYNDDSCVDIYPENLSFVNMKIYLLVSGYFAISMLTIILINCFIANGNEGDNIVSIAILSILFHISRVFLVIWNIIGAVIFWGTLNKQNYCSKSTNAYLFVSLIIKLFGNFCNIMMSNNKKEK
jgi:hypothetical protein